MATKLLIIDDEPDYFDAFVARYGTAYVITREKNPIRGIAMIADGGWDLVSFDLDYGDGYQKGLGNTLPKAIEKAKNKFPLIVITSDGSVETKFRAMETGAVKVFDKAYVTPQILHEKFQRILMEFSSKDNNIKHQFHVFSDKMRAIKKRLTLLTNYTHLPVLILGETGVGKEVAARYLHEIKDISAEKFQATNLTAIPGELFHSTLFGHLKGSFTNANSDQVGLATKADGGTLFLDEIGEISEDIQIKLLRVVQERTYRPLGGSTNLPLDTHLVFATNRNLSSMVEQGGFRQDFYQRINSITIHIPPLRERKEEIFPLAQHFFQEVCHEHHPAYGKSFLEIITNTVKERLRDYSWPGNIRELANIVQKLVFEADILQVDTIDLPLLNVVLTPTVSPAIVYPMAVLDQARETIISPVLPTGWSSKKNLAYHDLQNIERALIQEGGRKKDAAVSLGFKNDTALYYRVKNKYFKEYPELFEHFPSICKIYKLTF